MAIQTGDILRVAARFTNVSGEDLYNVWHFLVTQRGSLTEQAFVDGVAFQAFSLVSPILAYCDNNIVSQDAKVDRVVWDSELGKEIVVESFPISDQSGIYGGSLQGESLPPGCAPLVRWRTAGVKTMARKFLPPVVEAQTQDGELSQNVLTAMATIASNALLNLALPGGQGGAIQAVVHSKRLATWVTLLSGVAESVIAYQRRRRQGVGS